MAVLAPTAETPKKTSYDCPKPGNLSFEVVSKIEGGRHVSKETIVVCVYNCCFGGGMLVCGEGRE
jgi:hypothetical protein